LHHDPNFDEQKSTTTAITAGAILNAGGEREREQEEGISSLGALPSFRPVPYFLPEGNMDRVLWRKSCVALCSSRKLSVLEKAIYGALAGGG